MNSLKFTSRHVPPDNTKVQNFESKAGILLPSGYREFLSTNGGGFLEEEGKYYHDKTGALDSEFIGIAELFSFEEMQQKGASRLRDDVLGLLVGVDDFGNYVAIGVGPADAGLMYYVDTEGFSEKEPVGAVCELRVDFARFINELGSDD